MRRSWSWGFPRWQGYGKGRDAVTVRMCDHEGCSEAGEHPAPKRRDSDERWWFCQRHAAEYNRAWNYFEGMSRAEWARAAEEERRGRPFAGGWRWAASGDGDDGERSRSPAERAALSALGLSADASGPEIKARFRHLAKESHPDANNGDREAETRFRRIKAAYEVLRTAASE